MNQKGVMCKFCSSKQTIKKGKRKNKFEEIPIFQCKDCKKRFTLKSIKNKTYPAKIILNAISLYNLGYTQNNVSKLIGQKFRIKIPQRTISEWIKEYKPICTYNKLRTGATKLYKPSNIIFSKRLEHNQIYNFQYHKAKLELLFKDIKYNNQFYNTSQFYEPLKNYLEKIPTKKFPHHIFRGYKEDINKSIINNKATSAGDDFGATKSISKESTKTTTTNIQSWPDAEIAKSKIDNDSNKINRQNNYAISVGGNGSVTEIAQINNDNKNLINQRASQIKFDHLNIEVKSKNNFACKLASLALNLASSNKDRHQAIQTFMLINDSTTIAVEIPIYLTNWDVGYYRNQKGFIFPLNNYKTPITGHIDMIQVRNGLIHILDYKPDADKQQPIEQLTLYAMALSRKLNLPLYFFKAAWFDENNYYEFFPLHAVYKKQKG